MARVPGTRTPKRWRRPVLRRSLVLPLILGALVLALVAAAAVAAAETHTVTSYWRGLWWAISLITTVGFIGAPPTSLAGAVLSVVLMIFGFLMLAMVSAALASLFVAEEEQPYEASRTAADAQILAALEDIQRRLAVLEAQGQQGRRELDSEP
jgi:voltage-gated potassium channel